MTRTTVHGVLRVVAFTGLVASVSACTDYLARRDTVTLGSGEAVQANMAMHTIDPWPPGSRRIYPYTDGERLQHAIERYRNPVTSQNSGGPPIVPFGAGATAPSVPPATQ